MEKLWPPTSNLSNELIFEKTVLGTAYCHLEKLCGKLTCLETDDLKIAR